MLLLATTADVVAACGAAVVLFLTRIKRAKVSCCFREEGVGLRRRLCDMGFVAAFLAAGVVADADVVAAADVVVAVDVVNAGVVTKGADGAG